eukprot:TRINITY_DN22385_c0_g1_i2.p1 TRINITY_DN22385_c0_g1~~TRINITY_DN22385_c0_g1_i2.p1  ORF type:complete len:416 (-),score=70.72 TRINITY_DN22385_c0_g1_i2:133-1380(-)
MCGDPKMKLIFECGHQLCETCAKMSLVQKIFNTEKEDVRIECRFCIMRKAISKIVLRTCGCECSTRALTVKKPFQFCAKRNAFEWPSCENLEHKLHVEDILLIWGVEGVAHLSTDLSPDQFAKVHEARNDLSFLLVSRELNVPEFTQLMKVTLQSAHIQHLFFGPNLLDSERLKLLFDILIMKPQIITISIKESLGKYKDLVTNFAECLNNLSQLENLDLSNNDLGMEGAKALSEGLITMKPYNLKMLFLGNNNLGVNGMKWLADALVQANELRELFLENNRIGMKGAKYLASILDKLQKLEVLNLAGNGIGAIGAKALVEPLGAAPKLEILSLQSNEIATEGAKHVAEALEKSRSLSAIFLQQNRIGVEAAKKLAEVLEHSQLRWLNMADNYICLLYTSPSPRDLSTSRMPSSA